MDCCSRFLQGPCRGSALHTAAPYGCSLPAAQPRRCGERGFPFGGWLMARTHAFFSCALIVFAACVSGRSLQQLGQVSPFPQRRIPSGAPAPAPEPVLAPAVSAAGTEAPAAQPPCSVSWQANVQQTTATSATSVNTPACVIVYPGVTAEQCAQRAQAEAQTFVPTSDPGQPLDVSRLLVYPCGCGSYKASR